MCANVCPCARVCVCVWHCCRLSYNVGEKMLQIRCNLSFVLSRSCPRDSILDSDSASDFNSDFSLHLPFSLYSPLSLLPSLSPVSLPFSRCHCLRLYDYHHNESSCCAYAGILALFNTDSHLQGNSAIPSTCGLPSPTTSHRAQSQRCLSSA